MLNSAQFFRSQIVRYVFFGRLTTSLL